MKKILIIDDDPRNIFALSAVLKSYGYTIVSASNMSEAFAVLEKDRSIAVILLDMMMPDMDGYQAIPILRGSEATRHIPIISVTAQAMAGDCEKCLAAGADGYISKPVDVAQLFDLLQQYFK